MSHYNDRLQRLRRGLVHNSKIKNLTSCNILKKMEPFTDANFDDMKLRSDRVLEQEKQLKEEGHTWCLFPPQLRWCGQTPCTESTDIAKLKIRDGGVKYSRKSRINFPNKNT